MYSQPGEDKLLLQATIESMPPSYLTLARWFLLNCVMATLVLRKRPVYYPDTAVMLFSDRRC